MSRAPIIDGMPRESHIDPLYAVLAVRFPEKDNQ